MSIWHIHIQGQVQGVGFRPFIYLLANKHGLSGSVCNSMDGVHIKICAEEKGVQEFINEIKIEAPSNAHITAIDLEYKKEVSAREVLEVEIGHFKIIESAQDESIDLMLSPDFAICSDCRAELQNPSNRRYNYPFITCTQCGPRYSIIDDLPYDRERTVMNVFTMCLTCKKEYEDIEDRRYYSQTNSCDSCSIRLELFGPKGLTISYDNEIIFQKIVNVWQDGGIVAIKGIGGYLLTCDASNSVSISQLRTKKHRKTKPLAVMYPDIKRLSQDVIVDDQSRNQLESAVSPIVILPLRNLHETNSPCSIDIQGINGGQSHIGVMLPYAPLFQILLDRFDDPIVATSGNVSREPILYNDQKAILELTKIADFILANNREIVVPQDDSVIKYSPFYKKKIILRRSRGLAPSMLTSDIIQDSDINIFAVGALLKSSFTFTHRNNIFVSQYLGDLQSFETEQSFRHTMEHFFKLFKSTPDILLCDAHPDYTSTYIAKELSTKWKLPLNKIPHHEAHFAAILAEHKSFDIKIPIMGVIWDGVGLGQDGNAWGGEFFRYENYAFERIKHLPYFPIIAGDKMAKEPRLSLLSLCEDIPQAVNIIKAKFSGQELSIYQKMLLNKNGSMTSSMGRLFDAVSCLLGFSDIQNYEGEAAQILEDAAYRYFIKNGLTLGESYSFLDAQNNFSTDKIILSIINDQKQNLSPECISAKFHFTLVRMIEHVANKANIHHLAFSGGVFQNAILVDLIVHHLGKKNNLLFHQQLSPNDENISFGQVAHYMIRQRQKGLFLLKE